MRITFTASSFGHRPVGSLRVAYALANELVRRGHEVTVVHTRQVRRPHRPTVTRPRAMAAWARQHLQGSNAPPTTVTWQEVDPRVERRYVAKLDVDAMPDADVCVANAWWNAAFVAELPARKGRPLYHVHGWETFDGPQAAVARTWRLPIPKLLIARWLFDVGRRLGVPEAEMTYVPNGVDTDRFRVTTPIARRPQRVAMLYRSLPVKGARDGLTALRLAREQVPSLTAVLFGVEPAPRDLPAWVEYRHDPSPESLVEEVYNSAAVYLCPALQDAWHLPNVEAMACGCAVVSTAIGGLTDYGRDGVDCLVAPLGEPEALAGALVTLLRDDERRIEMGREARRRSAAFSWKASADAFEAAAGLRS